MSYRLQSVHPTRVRTRACAAVEAWAMAVWIGALVGFAFIVAPAAFRIVTNLDTFAVLTSTVLGRLLILGYACGAVAIAAAVVRASDGVARRNDLGRILLILVMFGFSLYEAAAVVPAMQSTMQQFGGSFTNVAKDDPRRQAYDALHRQSTIVYGAVVLFGFAAIALSAVRPED
jgi:hypothetical protein